MRTPPPGHRRRCGRRTARPPAGPGNVALVLRQVTRDPQDPEPHRGSLVQLIQQRGQDAAAFGDMPVGQPVPPQVTGQLRARGRLPRLGQAEPQGAPQVLMVGVERGDPLRPPGPEYLLPRGQPPTLRNLA